MGKGRCGTCAAPPCRKYCSTDKISWIWGITSQGRLPVRPSKRLPRGDAPRDLVMLDTPPLAQAVTHSSDALSRAGSLSEEQDDTGSSKQASRAGPCSDAAHTHRACQRKSQRASIPAPPAPMPQGNGKHTAHLPAKQHQISRFPVRAGVSPCHTARTRFPQSMEPPPLFPHLRGTPAGNRGELLTLASCRNSAGAGRKKDTVAFFWKEGSQQNLTIREWLQRVGRSICLQAKSLAKGQHKAQSTHSSMYAKN